MWVFLSFVFASYLTHCWLIDGRKTRTCCTSSWKSSFNTNITQMGTDGASSQLSTHWNALSCHIQERQAHMMKILVLSLLLFSLFCVLFGCKTKYQNNLAAKLGTKQGRQSRSRIISTPNKDNKARTGKSIFTWKQNKSVLTKKIKAASVPARCKRETLKMFFPIIQVKQEFHAVKCFH